MTPNTTCATPNCPRPRKHGAHCNTCRSRIRRATLNAPDPLAIQVSVQQRRALPGLRRHERRTAGLQLTQLGLPAHEIARIFNVTPRTVYRWRATTRQTEPADTNAA